MDDFSTFGFVNGEGPFAKRSFGVGILPGDTSRDDALHQRLTHRVEQLDEVSRPPR